MHHLLKRTAVFSACSLLGFGLVAWLWPDRFPATAVVSLSESVRPVFQETLASPAFIQGVYQVLTLNERPEGFTLSLSDLTAQLRSQKTTVKPHSSTPLTIITTSPALSQRVLDATISQLQQALRLSLLRQVQHSRQEIEKQLASTASALAWNKQRIEQFKPNPDDPELSQADQQIIQAYWSNRASKAGFEGRKQQLLQERIALLKASQAEQSHTPNRQSKMEQALSALTSDPALRRLQNNLLILQEEYKAKKPLYPTRYSDQGAEEHPEILRLSTAVQTLKLQIKQRISQLATASSLSYQLAHNQIDLSAAEQALALLESERDQILRQVPQVTHHQLALGGLLFEKQTLEALQTDLLQSRTQQLNQGIPDGASLITTLSPPSYSAEPLFPGALLKQLLVLFLSGIASLLIQQPHAIRSNLKKQASKKQAQATPTLEPQKQLSQPVLGRIPWLEKQQWLNQVKEDPQLPEAEMRLSISTLRSLGVQHQRQVLQICNVYDQTLQSHVLLQLAEQMAAERSNLQPERVLILDTQLRTSNLATSSFGIDNIGPLFQGTSDYIHLKHSLTSNEEWLALFQERLIRSQHSPITSPPLAYLPLGLEPPYAATFIEQQAFSALITSLRQQFDWIFVDSPALLSSEEAEALITRVDALVLLVEKYTTSSQLDAATSLIRKHNGVLLGTIIREQKITPVLAEAL
ncbi:MAG: hypothetical protein K2X01_00535 [Cyanobacteria bacterium]|nr:hypothetical protein [Cyanobacteriota bacterium]